jgi:hypothetical protein
LVEEPAPPVPEAGEFVPPELSVEPVVPDDELPLLSELDELKRDPPLDEPKDELDPNELDPNELDPNDELDPKDELDPNPEPVVPPNPDAPGNPPLPPLGPMPAMVVAPPLSGWPKKPIAVGVLF